MSKLPVSVCIPVRNEEKNLPACLKSLCGVFDEVVIVDSASTDGTRQIALDSGAVLLDFDWNGRLPKKRNWVLQTYKFRHEWVLFLDADERLTPQFIDELSKKVLSSKHVGYWISFNNWFMGQPLRYGDVFCKLALFRIDAGKYEEFPEKWWSHLDMEIHEHPVLHGTIGIFANRLEHHDYKGLAHYITKHNEYSTWEAHRYQWLKSADESAWTAMTSRQKFKYRYLHCWWMANLYFLLSYCAKLGFLDGWRGLQFAGMKRRYFQDIRLKIIEASFVTANGIPRSSEQD